MRRRIFYAGLESASHVRNPCGSGKAALRIHKTAQKMPYNVSLDMALPRIRAASRKQVYEILSEKAGASLGAAPRDIFNALTAHESDSPAGIGGGIAIAHLKMKGLGNSFFLLATLETPADFDALDGAPVDIVCLLLSPEENGPVHLQALSRISRLLNNTDLCGKLRDAQSEDMMAEIFANPDGWLIAA